MLFPVTFFVTGPQQCIPPGAWGSKKWRCRSRAFCERQHPLRFKEGCGFSVGHFLRSMLVWKRGRGCSWQFSSGWLNNYLRSDCICFFGPGSPSRIETRTGTRTRHGLGRSAECDGRGSTARARMSRSTSRPGFNQARLCVTVQRLNHGVTRPEDIW